jgi:hypothetical protein
VSVRGSGGHEGGTRRRSCAHLPSYPNVRALYPLVWAKLLMSAIASAGNPWQFPFNTKSSEQRGIPMTTEMTLTEVIADPMIAQLNSADKIDPRQFAQLMQSASRVLNNGDILPRAPLPPSPKVTRIPIKCIDTGEVRMLIGRMPWALPLISSRDLRLALSSSERRQLPVHPAKSSG